MEQIECMFEFIKPTRIELIIRKMDGEIDPLEEMGIPKETDLNFLHIAVTSADWEGKITPALVEEAVDELNTSIVANTGGDSLVGSIYFLNDDTESLPDILKKCDIPIDKIPYEYYKRPK